MTKLHYQGKGCFPAEVVDIPEVPELLDRRPETLIENQRCAFNLQAFLNVTL